MGLPVREGRRCKRIFSKMPRGSLVVGLNGNAKRVPCLVIDFSIDGFRLRGSFHLRRGQIVEVILGADPLDTVRCSVVWVGKMGSKHEGEVGLETAPER
jgi:PilZ domain-containing protein